MTNNPKWVVQLLVTWVGRKQCWLPTNRLKEDLAGKLWRVTLTIQFRCPEKGRESIVNDI